MLNFDCRIIYVCSTGLYGCKTWRVKRPERRILVAFENWRYRSYGLYLISSNPAVACATYNSLITAFCLYVPQHIIIRRDIPRAFAWHYQVQTDRLMKTVSQSSNVPGIPRCLKGKEIAEQDVGIKFQISHLSKSALTDLRSWWWSQSKKDRSRGMPTTSWRITRIAE